MGAGRRWARTAEERRGQERETQGKGWGPARQVGVKVGSEPNSGRDLRQTGVCRRGAHSGGGGRGGGRTSDPTAWMMGSSRDRAAPGRTTHRGAELWLALALAAFLRLQVQVKHRRHARTGPAGSQVLT